MRDDKIKNHHFKKGMQTKETKQKCFPEVEIPEYRVKESIWFALW